MSYDNLSGTRRLEIWESFLRTLSSEDVDIQNEQLRALTEPPLNRRQIMCTQDGTVASGAGRHAFGGKPPAGRA